MGFKINNRTRVKYRYVDLILLTKKFINSNSIFYTIDEFILNLETTVGLKFTSTRVKNVGKDLGCFYYFKVIDKPKYFLAKIKYGI